MTVRDGALEVGSIVQGGYEILGEIGAGTFGRVYEARQLSTGQKVAIKILRLSDKADEGERTEERFRREMLLAARLSHPNIVRLIDSGETESGLLYAVFQYVPGVTLKEVLAREQKLSLTEALHLMSQVLDALSCAHAEGVVHRDLKPENIMVSQTGVRRNALVLDFGLGAFAQEGGQSRLTASRDLMGTPCYAAPEQLRGEPPSVRSDLYSWGLTLLECLTGELAISGGSAQEVVYKQLGPEPVPIPAWLRSHALGPLLAAVTQKKIEKRDVTIAGLLEALAAILVADTAPPKTLEVAAPASERRQLTVLCCQTTVLVGAGRELHIEDLDEVLQVQQEAQARIVQRNGGQPAGVMAERAMFVFGFPTAHEEDAGRAARAALQITAEMAQTNERLRRDRGIEVEVRVGAHTGIVVVRALQHGATKGLGRLAGLTPRIAGELALLAGANEVIASADTVPLLREECATTAAGSVILQETTAAIAAFRLDLRPSTRSGRDTLSLRQETALVGRAQPLAQLRELWSRAQSGQPDAIVLRGDPGIGKSRLLRELRRNVPSESWFQSRCLAEAQGSPLRPLADLLAAIDEPLDSLLLRLGFDLTETLPLFAALLNWPLDRYKPLSISADLQKELTLGALVDLFARLAESRPLVFSLEDLHWADATTLELVALLLQRIGAPAADGRRAPRLLAVFTARPELAAESLPGLSVLSLKKLDDREVAEMIAAALSPGTDLERTVIDEVVRRADGIPLFVEEVTRAITGGATGAGDGGFQVPATLRDLLASRLDRVPATAKETALLAAVLGREFRYEILRAVSTTDEADLRDSLAELQASGLVDLRRSVRSESYAFRHALLRDAAYDSLTRAARQRLHQRVANTLRHRFPDIERNRPETLALHFEGGGQIDTAVEYLHRAGSQALHRAAYRESMVLLEHGLELSRGLEESTSRRRQEAELLATIGGVQISLQGYAAPQVEETFRLAGERCEGLEGDIATHVLFGVWAAAITRSDAASVPTLLPRFRRIIEHSGDPVARLTAYSALGCGGYWRGDFEEAEESFVQGRLLFSSEEFQRFSLTYGYSAGLYAYALGMLNLWCLGYADRAKAVRAEFLRIAELARDPYVTVAALSLGLTLSHDCDEPEGELELADRLLKFATEQGMPMWWGAASLGRGGAFLRRGHAEEALPLILDGLQRFRLVGVNCSYNHFLQYLIDAYLQIGKPSDALATIQQSQSLCQTQWARAHEPELLRMRGEVELMCGDPTTAERSFREAIAMARRFSGKFYELRASMSLARLLRVRGQKSGARESLAPVLGWFSEGFDTPDLRQARAVLAEL